MTGARLTTAMALWLGMTGMATAQAAAARAAGTCLAPAEAESLVASLMPDALATLGRTCAPVLPPEATLRAGLPGLIERYRADAASDRAGSNRAIGKIAGQRLHDPDTDALHTLVAGEIAASLAKSLKVADCPKFDRAIALLAPLPPRNLAALFVMIIVETQKDDKPAADDDFTICPTSAAP